jgi:hypothetical protein
MEMDILELKIGQSGHGISTEAKWAQSMVRDGSLCFDPSFQTCFKNSKYADWPTNQLPVLPSLKSSQTDGQSFVD